MPFLDLHEGILEEFSQHSGAFATEWRAELTKPTDKRTLRDRFYFVRRGVRPETLDKIAHMNETVRCRVCSCKMRFTSNNLKMRTCSAACWWLRQRQANKDRPRPPNIHACAVCGAEFNKRSRVVSCSSECQRKRKLERQLEAEKRRRRARGLRKPGRPSRYTPEIVLEMRQMRANGETLKSIATHFNCDVTTVFYKTRTPEAA